MTTIIEEARKLVQSTTYRKKLTLAGRKVTIEKRSPEGFSRFGGGWKYVVGVQVGGSGTVIINLLVFSIRIDPIRK